MQLLVVNVVSVIVAAKFVFLAKGVRPRTWYERNKARQSTVLYGVAWTLMLLLMLVVLFVRRQVQL
jgi:uncharacterized membrane protein